MSIELHPRLPVDEHRLALVDAVDLETMYRVVQKKSPGFEFENACAKQCTTVRVYFEYLKNR